MITGRGLSVCVALIALNAFAAATDEFAECLDHEVCIEKHGITNAKNCLEKLSTNDTQYVQTFFIHYYNDPKLTIETFLAKGCQDSKKAKQGVNEYYDTRKSKENKDGFTAQDEEKLISCRNCFMGMIEECQLKKQMGFL